MSGKIIRLAAEQGSTATTYAGAMRYLRGQIAETPKFDSIRNRGAWNRDAAARHRYERGQMERRAERIAAALGAMSRTDAEGIARASVVEIPVSEWPYRRAKSSWAGGDLSISIFLAQSPQDIRASVENRRVWSSNGKWSGNDTYASLTVTARAIQIFPGLISGGLVHLDAEPVGIREYRAVWCEQGRGVSMKIVEGWVIRGYHVRGNTLERARKIVAQKRTGAVLARLSGREARWKRIREGRAVRGVWVSAQDSIRGGNCPAGTENFEKRISRHLNADGKIGAVRGDVLLTFDDSREVRRAVTAAMSRQA